MIALAFAVEKAEPLLHAASPELLLTLAVRSEGNLPVHGGMLACQLRIDVTRRGYDDAEAERLFELFGPRAGWSRTQQSLLWAQPTLLLPAFAGSTTVGLALPCPLGFELAAGKYLQGLASGTVPLLLLFSGTVFYADESERLQAGPVARTVECRYALPLEVYRRTVEHYFADRTPVTLERELLQRLQRYQRRSAAPTLDVAVGELLDRAEAGA